ncbi:pyruvate kinase [Parvibium lacunae]|uniref:Pyruvate kinase n=1 Tax=Parvibium lacunae TaxID=1888893 RepID=A0A368L1V6_9BURK|nr:pyruvate kinase [Parvibium lacunae]RCS57370.1 pyruvate kinase [Parvibium lacunae]
MVRTRHTKMIATLGPATSTLEQICALVKAGVNVFRLNFSHGTHADHAQRYRLIREAELSLGVPIGILGDLQGPKLRVGQFQDGKVKLENGSIFTLDSNPEIGNAERVYLPHPEIFTAIKPGELLLIDDGKLCLRVESADSGQITTRVLVGGLIADRKGVNLPGTLLPVSALTEKDRRDLDFALGLGIDWIALSFVQRAQDIEEIKHITGRQVGIIAKLEKPQAIEDLEAIIQAADAVMVARGDLGVEMPVEAVPVLQKRIVRHCREQGKPVIVATQMLESMIHSPTPTRAEASDVATAVYDGVDAVMLSAESASGAFPLEAVTVMHKIIHSVESDPLQQPLMQAVHAKNNGSTTDAIGAAIKTIAEQLQVTATVTYTSSGASAFRVAHERPPCPIIGLTPSMGVARRLCLVWGVQPIHSIDATSVEDMVTKATQAAGQQGLVAAGRPLTVVAGMPFGVSGSTNLLRIVWPDSEMAA